MASPTLSPAADLERTLVPNIAVPAAARCIWCARPLGPGWAEIAHPDGPCPTCPGCLPDVAAEQWEAVADRAWATHLIEDVPAFRDRHELLSAISAAGRGLGTEWTYRGPGEDTGAVR